MNRRDIAPSPSTLTAALAAGLLELLTAWRHALVTRDAELLDWLTPLIVERARLAARAGMWPDAPACDCGSDRIASARHGHAHQPRCRRARYIRSRLQA